jgi:signal transduction histidine kinase/ActR/RegA family two-component response regulator
VGRQDGDNPRPRPIGVRASAYHQTRDPGAPVFGPGAGPRGLERELKSGPEGKKKRAVATSEGSRKGPGAAPETRPDGSPGGPARAMAKLTRKAEALEAEMRRRRDLEIELQDRMAELAEADRRKDEFLATLAHELRNPLAPIKMAAMLSRSNCACGGSQRYLDMIERQADNLTRLVDDLIEVSRVTHGKLELKCERIALATIVTRAVDSARSLLEQRRHSVTVTLPEGPVLVVADPLRLEQALVNLLANAAKYTPPDGEVEVVVEARDRSAEIRVRDNGVGIPSQELHRVFDLFRQVPNRSPGSQGGLGIGLTMARALVEMHGGTIHVTSRGPGSGSEFVIRIPLADVASRSAAAPRSAGTNDPVGEPRRVLVVDDNVDAGEALEELLRSSGHEVRRVRDGRSALRTAREFHPDVVLLDLAMPRMDGYEVASRIRASYPDIRLIAVTGYSQPHHHRRAADVGISCLLVKPVRVEALLHALGDPPGPSGTEPSGTRSRARPSERGSDPGRRGGANGRGVRDAAV